MRDAAPRRPGHEQLLLTRQLGRPVHLTDGRRLGRLADLTVAVGSDRPHLLRALVAGQRGTAHLLPCDDLTGLPRPGVPLRLVGEIDHRALDDLRVEADSPSLRSDELLLRRDVLDTQVVDLRGRHLTRVADVLLEEGERGRLHVASVELGWAGVLRRLGLHRLAARAAPRTAGWSDLHLTSRRGHVLQLDDDVAGFRRLDPVGLAELLARLGTTSGLDVLRSLEPTQAAAALRVSHPRTGHRLAGLLTPREQHELAVTGVEPRHGRRLRRTEGWRLHRPPRSRP